MYTVYNKNVARIVLVLALLVMWFMSSCNRTPLEDQAVNFIQQSCGEQSAMMNCNSQLP